MKIFKNIGLTGWLNLFLRSFQLIVGLVVIGMYATDLGAASKADKYTDGKWVRSSDPKTAALTSLPPEIVTMLTCVKVFAVITGTLSAVTALVFSMANIFFAKRTVAALFALDLIICVLYAAISGIFGSMFLKEKVEMESGIQRMKTAVYFDFLGLALWFVTATLSGLSFWRSRFVIGSKGGASASAKA